MIYEKDTMPDGTIYERYEGTPEEIEQMLYISKYKVLPDDADLTRTAINIVNLQYKINEMTKEV